VRRPNTAHESGPWRISGIEPDLKLEAVWALPAHGGAGDFQALLDQTNARGRHAFLGRRVPSSAPDT
jgi:hypothetical protein